MYTYICMYMISCSKCSLTEYSLVRPPPTREFRGTQSKTEMRLQAGWSVETQYFGAWCEYQQSESMYAHTSSTPRTLNPAP